MAEEDYEALEEQLYDLQHEIEEGVIPKQELDSKNVIFEIR